MNCYSYAMGVPDKILELKEAGFIVEKLGSNYGVTFSESGAVIWERFIADHMECGYYNEYLGEKIVFLFKHLSGEIEKCILSEDNERHILKLCSLFAETEFSSISDMLSGNEFYRRTYFGEKKNKD